MNPARKRMNSLFSQALRRAAMPTVRDILNDPLPAAEYLRASTPSLSQKPWASEFHSITHYTFYEPYKSSLNVFLGEEGEDDPARLDRQCTEIPCLTQSLTTEGDVVRDWNQSISQAVRLAYTHPAIRERSECGPLGPSNVPQTVDHYFSFMHNGNGYCIALGELKTFGIINAAEWGARNLGPISKRLSKELRGYAYKYNTPQVYCYDGDFLLILQFRAFNREHIKASTCPVACMVIPRIWGQRGQNNVCSMRYAVYRLISQGIKRCVGWGAPSVNLGGYPRSFVYFSGTPQFATATGVYLASAPGFTREYYSDLGVWYWKRGDEVVRDTLPMV